MIKNILLSFDPLIWGTVSDWTTVFVTGLTGYLIYATLKSQIRVQNLQQDVTAFAAYSHKQSILPVFTFEKPIVTTKIERSKIIFTEIICDAILANNIAKNVKYSVLPSQLQSDNNFNQDEYGAYLAAGSPFQIRWQHEIDILSRSDSKYSYSITFACMLYFEDIDGNKYKQECSVSVTNKQSTLVAYRPLPFE